MLQLIILGLLSGTINHEIQNLNVLINYGDADGKTALSWDAKLGKKDVVEKLLDNHADVLLADSTSRTPFTEQL